MSRSVRERKREREMPSLQDGAIACESVQNRPRCRVTGGPEAMGNNTRRRRKQSNDGGNAYKLYWKTPSSSLALDCTKRAPTLIVSFVLFLCLIGVVVSGDAKDLDERSKPETSIQSDSEGESDYVTGAEDFPDNSTSSSCPLAGEVLNYLDPSHSSAFIQSVLYEDSCAGVAVVDLFVAVKMVKDKMDVLAKANNAVLETITTLNSDTRAIRAGFRDLIEDMRDFLTVITEETASRAAVQKPCQQQEPLPPRETLSIELEIVNTPNEQQRPEEVVQDSVSEYPAAEEGTKRACVCWRHEKSSNEWKLDCLGCLLSTFSKKAQTEAPILNEALLGSFIASLLWLQKKETVPATISKMTSQMEEEVKKEGSLDLSESKIQMICDICGILGENASATGGDVPTEPNALGEDANASNETTYHDPNERADGETASSLFEWKSVEDGSDDEPVFEEALAEFPNPEVRHNVTCMGDLSNNIIKTKNVSTFTTNDTMSSWIGKFANDIKTKIKKMKSKTNVTIVERPYPKSNRTLKKLAGAFEFAITANTPVGVFDVTVLQYQKRRRSKDLSKRIGKLVQGLRNRETGRHRPLPVRTSHSKDDDSWENDFNDSEPESVEGSLNEGEDDFEDFMDIYVGNSTEAPVPEKFPLTTVISKAVTSSCFEIQKLYPTYFVQEIVRKTLTGERSTPRSEQEVVSLGAGETQQKEVVIRRSSSDLVIYIQVEVERGQSSSSGELLVEYQTSSHGTQTKAPPPALPAPDETVIRLRETDRNGDSLFNIWNQCEANLLLEEREDSLMIMQRDGDEEKLVAIHESRTKTLSDSLSDVFTEREIQETFLEEEENVLRGVAKEVFIKNAKLRADVWHVQKGSAPIQKAQIIVPRTGRTRSECHMVSFVQPDVCPDVELQKALKLISEIENDVKDVKLSDAISILPRLESELRKHLQNKLRKIDADTDMINSVDTFFSAVDFWPNGCSPMENADDSKEKLHTLLKLLSDLEQAVKETEYTSNKLDLCDCDSSVIYKLLQELTNSIRELEETSNVMSLSQTLDIASQLDTAVRKYDSEIKKQSLGYAAPRRLANEPDPMPESNCLEIVRINEQLKNVRKKVFDLVEEEAIDMEERIERDFDRLDRLERENSEVLMFLEAFLQKTARRADEYENLKKEMQNMSQFISNLWENVMKIREEREKKESENLPPSKPPSEITVPENEPVKDTISDLIIALDSLKTRAKEKNEACREILSSSGFEKISDSEKSSRRSSRSSFTTKQVDMLNTSVREFKKIGESSLYMAWTKPEPSPSVSVLGYEIHVNGTLNQKVRNPQRHQAVLYSVDLSRQVEINLYAQLSVGPKVLIATLAYLDM